MRKTKLRPVCPVWTRNLLILVVGTAAVVGGVPRAWSASPAAKRSRALKEWESLDYGMFIHFGMSTFTGIEIDPGDQPSATYAPTKLDVDQWIRVARDAGMKYVVLTAKHVAGHCLWDSKVPWKGKEYDYDVATSGNPTDVVAEFMKACKKYGVRPGLYYCVLDKHNEPGDKYKGKVEPEYFELIRAQLAELHTHYPGIYEQWIDIPWKLSPAQRQELYDLIKKHSPACLVMMNNGFRDGAQQIVKGCWPSDLTNGERTVPPAPRHNPVKQLGGKTYYLPMEVCETSSRHWFYLPKDPPKPTRCLYLLYRNSVQRGANLLLDVPPDKTGRIPDFHVEALRKLKQAIDNPRKHPAPITLGRKAHASHVHQGNLAYGAQSAVDDDYCTRWATPNGVTSAWLEVDLGRPTTFDRAVLMEAYPELDRIRAFRIEYMRDGQWRVAHEGKRIGAGLEVSFKPVTARLVRLNVTEAEGGPAIWDFQLFEAAKE